MISQIIGKKLLRILHDLLVSQKSEILSRLHEVLQKEDLPLPDNLEGPTDAFLEASASLVLDGVIGFLDSLS